MQSCHSRLFFLLAISIVFAVSPAKAQTAPLGQGAASVARRGLAPGLVPTTTTVTSSQNPSQVGQSVTFTATVTAQDGGLPTGTVDYTDNGNPISGCIGLPLNDQAQALCQISNLGRGGHIIVANYSGDQHYAPSAGQIDQIVDVYIVLHTFTGGADGENPWAGLAIDRAGNLYGTAFAGGGGPCTTGYGQTGCGTVYKLTHRGSGWITSTLYSFLGGNDGALPQLGALTIAADGTLYGTTVVGGGGPCTSYDVAGCGTIFHLRPRPSICTAVLCPWTETVLYRFMGVTGGDGDGQFPFGGPTFDHAGNLYGTAGSYPDYGHVYELTPSGGSWTFGVAYSFSGSDGQIPVGELIFDQAGNLYGTTWVGGDYGRGTAYELTPSGSGWTDAVIHSFNDGVGQPDGGTLYAGLILDGSGNLYGATSNGGSGGGGTVFELTPSDGGWTFNLLYSLVGTAGQECGVYGDLVMDRSGNLYGATHCDGANGKGSIFELSPSGGNWTYTDLYDFTGGNDGANPYGGLVLDSNGNLYGTAYAGGTGSACSGGCGVVFELQPPSH